MKSFSGYILEEPLFRNEVLSLFEASITKSEYGPGRQVVPKIKKLDKDKFISYIDESYLGGITIRGQGEVQKIEPPRNQFSFGPFIGVAYNGATGLTEPIIGVGVSYNLIKVWDWR